MSKSLDGVLIKRAHRKESFTIEQIKEFAQCAEPKRGVYYFLNNFFYIQHPTKGKMKYIPFEYQERLIDTYHSNRFSIALMPRQTGKSTTAAGYLLWYAMFVPDSTILIAANKYSSAQEIMQRIRYAYELCPDHIRCGVVSYNKGSIEFDNGSRIVAQATTENTGRGMSVSFLYSDEFAFVRPTIAREFWTSISPTLATGGKAIITSTPNNDEDQFALIWKQANKCEDEYGNTTELGINGFKAFRSYWNEHPDRDEKWKSDELGRIGEERFRREFECEFVIQDDTLINPIKLMDLQGIEPIEKQGQVRWYKKPKKDATYLIALDPSLGTGDDYAAIQVFEVPSMIQVAEWKHNRTIIQRQIMILKGIADYLDEVTDHQNKIYYTVENNTLGEAALVSISELGEQNIPGTFMSESRKMGHGKRYRKGFNTTNKSKISACSKLKSMIEGDKLKINSKNLVSELKSYVSHGTSFAAKQGEHDDLVSATLLVIRMMQVISSYDADIDKSFKDSFDNYTMPLPFVVI